MTIVLMLGSAPMAIEAQGWPRAPFDHILAINNAHQLRADWDAMIHPFDFPANRVPLPQGTQRIVTQEDFVPAQNRFGGFVYAGGTMAFTAAYWALAAWQPRVLAVFGCDMVYPANGPTHFYGTGTPDPLRADITLQSLEAKSARLMILAAMQGCACVNLSGGPSRLVFPRATARGLTGRLSGGLSGGVALPRFDAALAQQALRREADLGYLVPSGRYWDEASRFDAAAIRALDALWLAAAEPLALAG